MGNMASQVVKASNADIGLGAQPKPTRDLYLESLLEQQAKESAELLDLENRVVQDVESLKSDVPGAQNAEFQGGPAALLRKHSDEWRIHLGRRANVRRSRISERTEIEAAEAETKRSSIAARRKALEGRCKYSRVDVARLKEVFDEYDADGDGVVTLGELRRALEKRKAEAQRYDGRPKTLKERQAAAGVVVWGHDINAAKAVKNIFLVDHVAPIFQTLDLDGSNSIEFVELLRLVFPHGSETDFSTMVKWTSGETPFLNVEREGRFVSKDTRRQISALFSIYDTDRDGYLTVSELVAALTSCGLNEHDIRDMVSEQDQNDDAQLDEEEFIGLMVSTAAFCDPETDNKTAGLRHRDIDGQSTITVRVPR